MEETPQGQTASATEEEERQTDNRETEAEPNDVPIFTTIILLCHSRNVTNIVQAFTKEIEDAPKEEMPVSIIWSGISGLLHQGVIALEWDGPLSKAFLNNLKIDYEIFDYLIYDWSQVETALKEQEKTGRNNGGCEGNDD